MNRLGVTAAVTIFGLTSGGGLPSSALASEELFVNSVLPDAPIISRDIGIINNPDLRFALFGAERLNPSPLTLLAPNSFNIEEPLVVRRIPLTKETIEDWNTEKVKLSESWTLTGSLPDGRHTIRSTNRVGLVSAKNSEYVLMADDGSGTAATSSFEPHGTVRHITVESGGLSRSGKNQIILQKLTDTTSSKWVDSKAIDNTHTTSLKQDKIDINGFTGTYRFTYSSESGGMITAKLGITFNATTTQATSGIPGDSYFVFSETIRGRLAQYASYCSASTIQDPTSAFGVTQTVFMSLKKQVGARMIAPNLDHVPGISHQKLAQNIKDEVSQVLAKNNISSDSCLGQYLLAQGVCDWVRTHVLYNQALKPASSNGAYSYSMATLRRFWTTELLLKEQTLYAVCAGITRLTLDLSHDLNLDCTLVNGFDRHQGNTFSAKRDHSWNVYRFRDQQKELTCIADNTKSLVLLNRAKQNGGPFFSPYCLPTLPSENGMCVWKDKAIEVDEGAPLMDFMEHSSTAFTKWCNWPLDTQMEKVHFELSKTGRGAVVNIPVKP